MNRNTLFAFAITLLVAAQLNAQEQTDTVQLDPLVATATRVVVPISKVTAAMTVIDGAELRQRGVRTVGEALRTVSGAAVVQTGSYGAMTSLFLRGGESDYVQVLIDGVQINSPGEQLNFSNLAVEDVERIEIVKGPTSVLYGSDAVTGVVQIFTRQRTGVTRGEVQFAGGRGGKIGAQADGSFNNGYLAGEVFGGNAARRFSAGVSHFATQGAYAFNNEHRNSSITARGSLRPDEQSDLSASLRYSSSRYHIPTDGVGQLSDRNQYQDAGALAIGVAATRRVSEKLNLQLELQHNHNDAVTDDQSDDPADTLGFYRFHSDDRFRRQNVAVRANYLLGERSTLSLGGELERQANRASSSSPFGDAPENTETRRNLGVYAQWLAEWSRLSLQLGARGEDNERFGNFATYRAGVAFRVLPSLRLRASGGTAFKEPRFFEQFAQGFVRGNPDLEPERSTSLEAGVDVAWRRINFSASYFDQRFEDLIQYVAAPPMPTDPNYLNVAGARSAGLELGATASLGKVTLNANYTWLDTEVTDEGDGEDPSFTEGAELLRRARYTGSLGAALLVDRINVSATAHYVGRRADLDFASFPANRVTLPSYIRVDLASQYRLTSNVSATLKLENALDEAYEEVLNFPAPQRVVYLGARLLLQ
jgi:vitamin B12 transporter